MSEIKEADLERLGREAAEEVAGAQAVIHVRAEPDFDWTDKQIYRFYSVIDRNLMPRYKPGEMRSRLGQNIRDRLLAKGDETYPHMQIISPEEWQAHQGA
jgi:hypothetical protein